MFDVRNRTPRRYVHVCACVCVCVCVCVCEDREKDKEVLSYEFDLMKLWEAVSVKQLPLYMILEPEVSK